MGALIEPTAPDPVAHKLSELYLQWWSTPDAHHLRQTIISHLQPNDNVHLNGAAPVREAGSFEEGEGDTMPLWTRHVARIPAPTDAQTWSPPPGSPDELAEAPPKRLCWGRPIPPSSPLSPIAANTSPPRGKFLASQPADGRVSPPPAALADAFAQPPATAPTPPATAALDPAEASLRKRGIDLLRKGGGANAPAELGSAAAAAVPPPAAGAPTMGKGTLPSCLRSPPPVPAPPPPLQLASSLLRSPSPCAELTHALCAHGMGTESVLSAQSLALLLRTLPSAPLPSMASAALWEALQPAADAAEPGVVRASALLDWFARHLAGVPASEWLLPLLVGGSGRNCATRDDLLAVAREVVARHAGLAFLAGADEFQEHYAATVVARILYVADPLRSGKVGAKELRRSGALWGALASLDAGLASRDINAELAFFSYEHFYVLFCAFCKLDDDSDHLLDLDDLSRYGGHSLSRRAAERVYAHRRLAPSDGLMEYEDFVFFLLSEEHKGSREGTGYWFRVLDVDGDGRLTLDDLSFFYDEQARRQAALGHDVVSFSDVMTQLWDAVQPKQPGFIALADLRRTGMAALFVNVLTNIHQFLASELSDAHRHSAGSTLTEWDRWAQAEYARLEEEEEAEETDTEMDEALREGERRTYGAQHTEEGGYGVQYTEGGLEPMDEDLYSVFANVSKAGACLGASGAAEAPF